MKNFKIKITNLNHDNVFYKEGEVYPFDETDPVIEGLVKSGNLEEVIEEGQVQDQVQDQEPLEPEHELLKPEPEPEHEIKSFKKGKK